MKISDMAAVDRILKREFRKRHAPINELAAARGADPFHILVSTILSARTRDETTAAVCRKLFARVSRPADLQKLSQKQLERLIHPIGFFRTKARNLKALPKALNDLFDGKVPDEIDDLCKLPGVGRKTANLVLVAAFNKPAICVDVHVHRIVNRLGLLKTRDPHETEMGLRRILPVRYWKTLNKQLVSFGQTVCIPTRPRCDGCPIYRFCNRTNVKPHARKAACS